MNKLKYHAKTTNFYGNLLKYKINLVTENYEMHNFIIKSIFICININGIEHDISLKMLTF
jgi:hypothetical protein